MPASSYPIQALEIKYETDPGTPPPFCYYYHIRGKVEKGRLQVQFDWVYHHREDLSEEEIQDEGFTGQDDYHWQGDMDSVWLQPIYQLITKTKAAAKTSADQPFLELDIRTENRTLFQGEPMDMGAWEYLLQEFIQGIYETSGKEAPLFIRFKQVGANKTYRQGEMHLFFANRTIRLQLQTSGSRTVEPALDWDKTKQFLQHLYVLEFYPEQAQEKEPLRQGAFIDIGEGVWYELGKSACNPPGRTDYIALIERQMEAWLHTL
jgi:hypothetical protein